MNKTDSKPMTVLELSTILNRLLLDPRVRDMPTVIRLDNPGLGGHDSAEIGYVGRDIDWDSWAIWICAKDRKLLTPRKEAVE